MAVCPLLYRRARRRLRWYTKIPNTSPQNTLPTPSKLMPEALVSRVMSEASRVASSSQAASKLANSVPKMAMPAKAHNSADGNAANSDTTTPPSAANSKYNTPIHTLAR